MPFNPYWAPHRSIGKTDAQWEAIKTAVVAVLQANANMREVPEALVRSSHPDLADDALYVQVKVALGLSG